MSTNGCDRNQSDQADSSDQQASAQAQEIRAIVCDLLLAHIEPPVSGDAPLVLSSLSLVMLAEDLEEELNFIVAARDLVPENFATVDKIVAYVNRRRSSG